MKTLPSSRAGCLEIWWPQSPVTTRFELDDPGIEFRLGRDFPHISRAKLGPTNILYNGYQVSSLR
jgi:hypothetical protein